jgi:hypothetical protein
MSKTTNLAALAGNNITQNDILEIVDISDVTTMSSLSGANKKVTVSALAIGLETTGTLQATIAPGANSDYWRGDKSWQPLNKAAVGLSSVDNTSDASKPVSTAQQTALNLKANSASPLFTGNVGIGTAVPAALLDIESAGIRINVGRTISSNSNAASVSIFGGVTENGANIELYGSAHSSSPNMAYIDANVTHIRSVDGATERMRVNSDGNVGIGTTTPSSKLQVNGVITATRYDGKISSSALVSGGAPGGALELNGDGLLQIKDLGVTTAKLENSTSTTTGVTTAKLADSSVTTAKLENSTSHHTGVTTAKLANGSVTLEKLAPEAVLFPAGAVMPFAMITAPPNGWLPADGRSISTSGVNAALFAAIGYTYGGSGASFNLPDLRGYFVRGSGRNGDGTESGTFGQKQSQDWKGFYMTNVNMGTSGSYSHSDVYMGKSILSYIGSLFTGAWSNPSASIGTKWDTSEVRPANIALLYCIKL